MSPVLASEPSSTTPVLHPLDEFYRRGRRTLPPVRFLEGPEVPEPYRTLLVHNRDMTRTLERFHHGRIHLRLISSWREDDGYWRESVLELDDSNRPVEFGAIKIHLNRFPDPWRTQILEERLPLGGILNASGMKYTSQPSAFFELKSGEFITCTLHLERDVVLYGRQNTLRDGAGNVLAEIVEILPPESSDATKGT